MIDVARIDYWAASGTGPLHRSSTVAKALLFGMVVSAAVISRQPFALVACYILLVLVAIMSKLPWIRIVVLSGYASLFALLYSLSVRTGSFTRLLIVMKAITPALAMLMLIVSTPYPRIFSLLSRILPEVLAAALFMTYRTLFILLDMMDNFVAAIRLRGGFSPGSLYKNSSNISRGIAMLLVRSVENASRLHAVMVVRGYNGSMADRGDAAFRKSDWLPIAAGISILSVAVVWK